MVDDVAGKTFLLRTHQRPIIRHSQNCNEGTFKLDGMSLSTAQI